MARTVTPEPRKKVAATIPSGTGPFDERRLVAATKIAALRMK